MCLAADTAGRGVRRQVSHLHPAKMVPASDHISSQRGHACGHNTNVPAGRIASGSQPRSVCQRLVMGCQPQ